MTVQVGPEYAISELVEKWLDNQIIEVFGISTRTVERIRANVIKLRTNS